MVLRRPLICSHCGPYHPSNPRRMTAWKVPGMPHSTRVAEVLAVTSRQIDPYWGAVHCPTIPGSEQEFSFENGGVDQSFDVTDSSKSTEGLLERGRSPLGPVLVGAGKAKGVRYVTNPIVRRGSKTFGDVLGDSLGGGFSTTVPQPQHYVHQPSQPDPTPQNTSSRTEKLAEGLLLLRDLGNYTGLSDDASDISTDTSTLSGSRSSSSSSAHGSLLCSSTSETDQRHRRHHRSSKKRSSNRVRDRKRTARLHSKRAERSERRAQDKMRSEYEQTVQRLAYENVLSTYGYMQMPYEMPGGHHLSYITAEVAQQYHTMKGQHEQLLSDFRNLLNAEKEQHTAVLHQNEIKAAAAGAAQEAIINHSTKVKMLEEQLKRQKILAEDSIEKLRAEVAQTRRALEEERAAKVAIAPTVTATPTPPTAPVAHPTPSSPPLALPPQSQSRAHQTPASVPLPLPTPSEESPGLGVKTYSVYSDVSRKQVPKQVQNVQQAQPPPPVVEPVGTGGGEGEVVKKKGLLRRMWGRKKEKAKKEKEKEESSEEGEVDADAVAVGSGGVAARKKRWGLLGDKGKKETAKKEASGIDGKYILKLHEDACLKCITVLSEALAAQITVDSIWCYNFLGLDGVAVSNIERRDVLTNIMENTPRPSQDRLHEKRAAALLELCRYYNGVGLMPEYVCKKVVKKKGVVKRHGWEKHLSPQNVQAVRLVCNHLCDALSGVAKGTRERVVKQFAEAMFSTPDEGKLKHLTPFLLSITNEKVAVPEVGAAPHHHPHHAAAAAAAPGAPAAAPPPPAPRKKYDGSSSDTDTEPRRHVPTGMADYQLRQK